MSAGLVFRQRIVVGERRFVDMVLWRLPRPSRGCTHPFKYRLAYVVDEACVLRYDNEAGKGDHRHLGRHEQAYAFTDVERLLADFWRDVEGWNDENGHD